MYDWCTVIVIVVMLTYSQKANPLHVVLSQFIRQSSRPVARVNVSGLRVIV